MMDVIQLNKFVKLHDGEKILFCNIGKFSVACDYISNLNHAVVLILGGTDYCVTDSFLKILPKNVRKLFCWNCLIDRNSYGDLIQPIPRGIEISESVDFGDFSFCGSEIEGEEKRLILSDPPNEDPTKFIYANFRVNTNYSHRVPVRDFAINHPEITWEEPYGETDRQRYVNGPSYMDFVYDILDHQAVLCPQGNDLGENLRVYETLYLSRVPLTFNKSMYDAMYHIFPTVHISDLNELNNRDVLSKRIDDAMNTMISNRKYLDFNYWKDMILNASEDL